MTRCASVRPVLALVAILALGGCRYTAEGSLPQHIQNVRVATFKNNTYYYGLEGRLTRAVIEKMVRDPRVQVVQHGEDALLTGEIFDVQRRVERSDREDRPTSIRLTVSARITFEDKVTGERLVNEAVIRSSGASSAAGVYDIARGEGRNLAEEEAIEELASEIVRRTVAIWSFPPKEEKE
ncbi:MAG: LPS assembly lipoprotein LptE [Planctomycetota bacterium]